MHYFLVNDLPDVISSEYSHTIIIPFHITTGDPTMGSQLHALPISNNTTQLSEFYESLKELLQSPKMTKSNLKSTQTAQNT